MHNISIPSWLPDQGLIRLEPPDMSKTALLVIDMQVVFCEEGQALASRNSADIIPNINQLADAVRRGGGKVVFTRHAVTDDGARALPRWHLEDPRVRRMLYDPFLDPATLAIDVRMDVQSCDLVIEKFRFGAFGENSSDLGKQLQENGVDTLIVVGVATSGCCETTAREAMQLGYKVFFVTDANATALDELHNAALMNLGFLFADLRDTEEMLKLVS